MIMKKMSLCLLGFCFVNASWATNVKGVFSTWVSQNNEELDLTKCTQTKLEDADEDMSKDAVAYECPVTFTTSEGTCTTQFDLMFDTKTPTEGMFVVDYVDNVDNKSETCGQKRYGEMGTFQIVANTLTLTALSEFWDNLGVKVLNFK